MSDLGLMKTCPDCKINLPLNNFPKSRIRSGGRTSYCTPCSRIRGKATREKHKERYREEEKKERDTKKYKDYHRKYRLRTVFGMTPEDYENIFEIQGHKCPICQRIRCNTKAMWHIDHDHSSGRVRGILCSTCNKMLGAYEIMRDNDRTQKYLRDCVGYAVITDTWDNDTDLYEREEYLDGLSV